MTGQNGSRGLFKIQTDNLGKFRSYLLSLLKQSRYSVDESTLSGESMQIVATKGNRLVHYVAEQLLEYVPLSEYFGWAVRVELTFHISQQDQNGCYTLFIASEPASNEISPIDEYFERYEQQGIFERTGEDEKCRKAFEEIARKILRSNYVPKA